MRATEELVRVTRTACEGALRSPHERLDDLKKMRRSLIEISECMLMNKCGQSQAGAAGVGGGWTDVAFPACWMLVTGEIRCQCVLDADNWGDTVSVSFGRAQTGWLCERCEL